MTKNKLTFVMRKNGDPVRDAKVDVVAASIQRDILAQRTSRNARVLRADIVNKFAEVSLGAIRTHKHRGYVMGATCADVKRLFRGRIHQDQGVFVGEMNALNLQMTWSDDVHAWVVHSEAPYSVPHCPECDETGTVVNPHCGNGHVVQS